MVDLDAHAADQKKVLAAVITVASHEVDTDSGKDESIIATSGRRRSPSVSEMGEKTVPASEAPFKGLEGSGGEGGGGRRSEVKGASPSVASRGLEGGFTLKGASRALEGGLKGA